MGKQRQKRREGECTACGRPDTSGIRFKHGGGMCQKCYDYWSDTKNILTSNSNAPNVPEHTKQEGLNEPN